MSVLVSLLAIKGGITEEDEDEDEEGDEEDDEEDDEEEDDDITIRQTRALQVVGTEGCNVVVDAI